MTRRLAIVACILFATALKGGDTVLVRDAIQNALNQSQLTQPGSQPFHLKAVVAQPSDPESNYRANIELFWVSPTKWHRDITSADFSQTLIMNGDSISEANIGDYYPHWLSNYVTALTNLVPAPILNALRESDEEIPRPSDSQSGPACTDFPARVDRWVICFQSSEGLFESVFSKGYFAEYRDYKKFGDKWVARAIRDYPGPGSDSPIDVVITELTQLTNPAEQLFEVKQPTPPSQRIRSVRVDEDAFYKLAVASTEIVWPPVGERLLKGGCGVFVSADRTGKVREAVPEGCDNAALQGPLHDAVMKWQLKPDIVDGVPVQVEALLGIPFRTTLDQSKSLPQLSDSEVRKLVTHAVDPVFPPGSGPEGAEITVQISVDDTGILTGVGNPQNAPTPAFLAINAALSKWRFEPYIKNGKPQYFHGELVFHVHYRIEVKGKTKAA